MLSTLLTKLISLKFSQNLSNLCTTLFVTITLIEGYESAIRTNLSLHKCFVRYEDDFGSFWMVDDAEFLKRRHLSRGRPRKYEPNNPNKNTTERTLIDSEDTPEEIILHHLRRTQIILLQSLQYPIQPRLGWSEIIDQMVVNLYLLLHNLSLIHI